MGERRRWRERERESRMRGRESCKREASSGKSTNYPPPPTTAVDRITPLNHKSRHSSPHPCKSDELTPSTQSTAVLVYVAYARQSSQWSPPVIFSPFLSLSSLSFPNPLSLSLLPPLTSITNQWRRAEDCGARGRSQLVAQRGTEDSGEPCDGGSSSPEQRSSRRSSLTFHRRAGGRRDIRDTRA